MTQPSYNWLAQGLPMLTEGGLLGPPGAGSAPVPVNLGGAPPAPPPMLSLPGAPAPISNEPPPAQAPPPTASPYENAAMQMSMAPQGPNMSAAPPPAPPPPPVPPNPGDVQFAQVGGGPTKAREMHTRGPMQDALLMQSFEHPAEAATNADFRNQVMADREDLEYQRQAESALKRQEAADQAATKRQVELDGMARDYNAQVSKLGQMHLDDNRWWASKSTGDKIGTTLLVLLGSVAALGGNGQNMAYNAVLKDMDNDLEAQKFDYANQMNRAKGAQNAFAMAMDRYQNEDAASAMVRAGALDFAAAKVAQLGAQWKGTESATAADTLRAQLLAERDRTAAAGLKFVPAGLGQRKYQMTVRGQVIPGLVDEKKAQEVALEHGVKPAEAADQTVIAGAVQGDIAMLKANAEAQAKRNEHGVVLPNGETVYAPGETEAGKLRELVTSTARTKDLVKEAKQLREGMLFRADPKARARLGQIQSDLLTDFGVMHKLGALSDKDYEIAQTGTADLFGVGPGVEARLERLNDTATKQLTTRVKTIPGAPPKSAGKMPGSTQYAGDKK